MSATTSLYICETLDIQNPDLIKAVVMTLLLGRDYLSLELFSRSP